MNEELEILNFTRTPPDPDFNLREDPELDNYINNLTLTYLRFPI